MELRMRIAAQSQKRAEINEAIERVEEPFRARIAGVADEGHEQRWGPEPDAWRPERPNAWKAPLPPPLTACAPRMVDVREPDVGASGPRAGRNRYAAMAAQAEQSARSRAEIEAELGPIEEAERGKDHQWWLTELLTYSSRGEVSVREAEGRLARAILTDGIRGKYGGPNGLTETSSALSVLVHETLLSTDADVIRERFEPSPRDVGDYEIALGWFAALNPPELWHRQRDAWTLNQAQCVLVWRMMLPPLSWRKIAAHGGSHAGVRQVYGAALASVHRAANGKPVLRHVTVKDRIGALRERNRRARIEGQNP